MSYCSFLHVHHNLPRENATAQQTDERVLHSISKMKLIFNKADVIICALCQTDLLGFFGQSQNHMGQQNLYRAR